MMPPHPPGLLALACAETARYSHCHASIGGIQRPAGSRYFPVSSLSPAANFNYAAQTMLAQPELQWILLLNDDHLYPPDMLIRLLDRRVDAVTALYLDRSANPELSPLPFPPVLFDRVDPDGQVMRRFLAPGEHGLIPIVACGDGAMLVRRSAFERIPPPWWTLGELDPTQANHDLSFCRRLRDAGFALYADLDVVVGHVTPMTLTPRRDPDGTWTTEIRGRHPQAIVIPQPMLEAETR
jgi:hypothetical protein